MFRHQPPLLSDDDRVRRIEQLEAPASGVCDDPWVGSIRTLVLAKVRRQREPEFAHAPVVEPVDLEHLVSLVGDPVARRIGWLGRRRSSSGLACT